MKGIYKKLSVGVLAAALLAGGSGVLQGGQAFADARSQRPAWEVEWDKQRDRGLAQCRQDDYSYKLEEKPFVYASKKYADGWDFLDDIKSFKLLHEFGNKNKFGVQIGDLYFDVMFDL